MSPIFKGKYGGWPIGLMGAVAHLAVLALPWWLGGGALTAPIVLFATLAALFSFAEAASQIRRDRIGEFDAAAAMTGVVLYAVFASALVWHSAWPAGAGVIGGVSGAVLFAGGIVLRVMAIRALGERFVTRVLMRDSRDLHTDGLYAALRHPSEAGTLCLSLGGCLLLGSWVALALWLSVLLPLVLVRVRLEDGLLRQTFGHRYAAYSARVPSLPPFIGRG